MGHDAEGTAPKPDSHVSNVEAEGQHGTPALTNVSSLSQDVPLRPYNSLSLNS